MLCWGYPRRTSLKTSILSLLHSKTIDFTAPSAQNAVGGNKSLYPPRISREALGALLGVLGRSWAALGHSWGALAALLGALVAPLEGFLAPLGPHLGLPTLNLTIFFDFLTSQRRFSMTFLDFWCPPVSLRFKGDS